MKLRIIDEIVEMIARVHRLSRKVARHDADLAKQMRRAVSSVGLNANEGLYGRGGNRTAKLDVAMCSGREVVMALRIAGAAGYLEPDVAVGAARVVDGIVGGLYRWAHPR